jgi:hypothetical protein
MPHHLYENLGSDDPDPLSIVQICDELIDRVNAQFDNREDPGTFADPYAAIRNRDKTIFQLGAAVITLSRIVKDLARDVDGLDDEFRSR